MRFRIGLFAFWTGLRYNEKRSILEGAVKMTNFQVKAAFFSPTGGTKRAVGLLAKKLDMDAEMIDLTTPAGREQQYAFGGEDLLLAACPVYSGQIPPVDGLLENLKGEGTPCVVMAAYGNRHYDDALAQMKRLLEARGFRCIGGIACIIPHIYSEKLGSGRPDAADMEAFDRYAQKVREKLAKGDFSPAKFPGDENPKKKFPAQKEMTLDDSRCSRCGTCAAGCPTGAIDPETLAIDEAKCISCMRCVRICPAKARDFNANKIRLLLETMYKARKEVECFL